MVQRKARPVATTSAGAGQAAGGSGSRLATMQSTGPLSRFVESMSRVLDRPVIDMTGLTGRYNIRLAYKPENSSSDEPGPSIFTAVTEQLGLRFEARKGPVEIVIIDSIERVREP